MKVFTTLVNGLVARWIAPMWDTDAIILEAILKSIKRSGFGPNLFRTNGATWTYGEPGMDNRTRRRTRTLST